MSKKIVDREALKSDLPHISKNDSDRHHRIHDKYLVDTYNDPYDKAMGWYYSLVDVLHEPVRCRCFMERAISPLTIGDKVKIVGMAPEDECLREMFVTVKLGGRQLAVPLGQLEPVDDNEDAVEIIEDWLYWCLMATNFEVAATVRNFALKVRAARPNTRAVFWRT